MVTGLASRVLATPLEQEHDLWRADEEDVRDISTPAARVIWRRVPEEARSSDTIDLVVLGLAVLGYFVKTLDTRAELRRAAALGEPADVAAMVPAGNTDQVAPWPG